MKPENSEIFRQLQSVSVWKRGSQRAPHKPLLLLLTLASVQRGEPRLTPYEKIHPQLEKLLVDFGPPRRSTHPEYPFWRLQNDGAFWEVPEREQALQLRGARAREGDVPRSVLEAAQVRGGFTAAVYDELGSDPRLINRIATAILREHFPPSLHESILDAVGMPWVLEGGLPTKRSAEFRNEVIRLYEHRCAMCGFDGRLGHANLGLEAAHIMWHALGGPDDPANSLLLCSLHHQAFDRGALALSTERRILVSQHLHGGVQVSELIIQLSGKEIRPPLDPTVTPAEVFMSWHRREVFRDPARPAA